MKHFQPLLLQLSADLAAEGARWAIIGGIAVGVRTEPRFTRDLDVAVPTSDNREAETLVRGLLMRGYRLLAKLEQTAVQRLATVRLAPPYAREGTIVDLLFASSGIEPEVVGDAEFIEAFDGSPAPVALTPHLIALKILSRDDDRREQDRRDLRTLIERASTQELEKARDLLALVTARGYDRGRDLQAAFDAAIGEFPRPG